MGLRVHVGLIHTAWPAIKTDQAEGGNAHSISATSRHRLSAFPPPPGYRCAGESAMEMDMEMPDPDELEWMESHSLVPEEEEDAYFDDPDEGFVPPPGDSDQPCDSPQPQDSAALRASMQCTPSLYIRT